MAVIGLAGVEARPGCVGWPAPRGLIGRLASAWLAGPFTGHAQSALTVRAINAEERLCKHSSVQQTVEAVFYALMHFCEKTCNQCLCTSFANITNCHKQQNLLYKQSNLDWRPQFFGRHFSMSLQHECQSLLPSTLVFSGSWPRFY